MLAASLKPFLFYETPGGAAKAVAFNAAAAVDDGDPSLAKGSKARGAGQSNQCDDLPSTPVPLLHGGLLLTVFASCVREDDSGDEGCA